MDFCNPKNSIRELLAKQKLGVLATHAGEQPYANLMAFTETEDLRGLLFGTPRNTIKYKNMTANPRAAMLFDNRSNEERDFQSGIAITAVGMVEQVNSEDFAGLSELFLAKHPNLREFVNDLNTALMHMVVESYTVVSQFQQVQSVKMI